MTNGKKAHPGGFLILGGLLLIAAALCLCLYNLWEDSRASASVNTVLQQLQSELLPQYEAEQGEPAQDDSPDSVDFPGTGNLLPEYTEPPAYVLNPQMQMPVQTIDGWDYCGILEIPSLGLSLPIIDRWSYPALKVSPCRYYGSAYTDDLVLAAHNYSSHFGSLKDLVQGDCVTFTDMDGNVFEYRVVVIETLMPDDVEEMTNGQWDLTLFTCTIGGQYRVTVRCDKIT